MPSEYVDAMFQFFVEGTYDDSKVLPTVRELTGRAPRTFAQWGRGARRRLSLIGFWPSGRLYAVRTAKTGYGVCNSVICMNPVDVFGAGLVRSSLIADVLTGSNVTVVGSLDAVANCTCWLLVATQSVPFQYDTVSELGSTRLALIVKYGTTELTCLASGNVTDTHSFSCARLTAGSVFVADLL